VVEQVTGRDHVLNHPEISMVGLTEVYHNFHCNEYCNEPALFQLYCNDCCSIYSCPFLSGCIYFSVHTGLTLLTVIYTVMQLSYRHIFGLHAADLIHEASNSIALETRIQVIFPPTPVIYRQLGT
jgi:hypothetical protein